jgi:DNA-binding response OmpR family regulator
MFASDAPCRVLIVEDDIEVAKTLQRLLFEVSKTRPFFFDVTITESAIEAAQRSASRDIDIFIVDLKLENESRPGQFSETVGMRLIPKIIDMSGAGIIVYSAEEKSRFYDQLLKIGADDYIQKTNAPSDVIEKLVAVWRRILSVRNEAMHLHVGHGRTFRVGNWTFTIGNRNLSNSSGEECKVGITEHELLKHLALSTDHSVDAHAAGLFVLRRALNDDYDGRKTLENLVYRLRNKLGDEIIVHTGGGRYMAPLITAMLPPSLVSSKKQK